MSGSENWAIVADKNFILATRDTGYRSTASAIAELVDNALEACANDIQILVREDGTDLGRQIAIAVLDDGHGMEARTLRMALQFGGTERFNDRSSLGRFGMGLPNSSVSQARRVEVYTWQEPGEVFYSYLDVDNILQGRLKQIPRPVHRGLPEWLPSPQRRSGTLVLWTKCDRLESRKAVTVAKNLLHPLARIYRYFLWDGKKICVNGTEVIPLDPLFLKEDTPLSGARIYNEPLKYEVKIPGQESRTSYVMVRFALLPVSEWHDLPVEQKRALGIVKGAGVSIVRGKREIDCGWYFMGKKRKENYDDWWRCEVSFEPELDDLFGVTHSKQQINPGIEICSILSQDMEGIAHSLNARVRKEFFAVKAKDQTLSARTATERDRLLPPIQRRNGQHDSIRDEEGARGFGPVDGGRGWLEYRIVVKRQRDPYFYSWQLKGHVLTLSLNEDHPFFTRAYGPACQEASSLARSCLELLLFALVRVEADAPSMEEANWSRRKREAWSNALAAFLDT